MAVYFEPRSPSWADYIAPAAQELLRGLVGGMFERDRMARENNQQMKLAEADQARKQAAIDRALAYVSDPVNSFDIRGNPEAAARSYMGASLHGIPVDKILNTFGSPVQMYNADLGDRARIGSLDPVTGQMQGQDHTYGLNPTRKYEQDEATRRQQMADRAANYRAGLARQEAQVKPQLVQDANGQYTYLDPRTARARPTGVMGPTGAKGDPKALLGTYTQLLKQFTDPYNGQPISGYEDLVAGLTEEVRGLMSSMANDRLPGSGAKPAPQRPQPGEGLPSGNVMSRTVYDGLVKKHGKAAIDRLMREEGYVLQ